jgi:hypothetical protein
VQFGVDCDLVQYENKVGTIEGIHSLNLQCGKNFKNVQKPSPKKMWYALECQLKGIEKKARSRGLAHSLWGKAWINHLI